MAKRKANFQPSKKGKKLFKKSKKSNRKLAVITTGPNPLPNRWISKMKYVESTTITCDAGGAGLYQYRMNSIFDPNLTSTGHQPYGHDTLEALFTKYRVFAFAWIIHVFPVGSASNTQVVVTPQNGTGYETNFDYAAERPRAISKVIQSAGGTPVVFKGKVSLAKLMGLPPAQYKADERTASDYGSNPSEVQNLNFQIQGSSNQAVRIRAILTYFSESFDPKPVAAS